MTVIKRTSNYDTWGDRFRGHTNKNCFLIANDGEENVDVVLSELVTRKTNPTKLKKENESASKKKLNPFAIGSVNSDTSTDFTIHGNEFVAQFLIDRKVVLTRSFNMKTERGFVFNSSYDELTFGLRESAVKLKPVVQSAAPEYRKIIQS